MPTLLLSTSFSVLTRSALDSVRYFPCQQAVQLLHLRREMAPQQEKKRGGEKTKKRLTDLKVLKNKEFHCRVKTSPESRRPRSPP